MKVLLALVVVAYVAVQFIMYEHSATVAHKMQTSGQVAQNAFAVSLAEAAVPAGLVLVYAWFQLSGWLFLGTILAQFPLMIIAVLI